jgi:hypothetical protein
MRASGMQFQRETLPRATSRSSEIKRERCIETTLPLSPLQGDFTIRRAAPRSHCLLALNRFPLSLSDDPLSMHPPDNRSFCHRSMTDPLPGGGQRPRAPLGFVSRGVHRQFLPAHIDALPATKERWRSRETTSRSWPESKYFPMLPEPSPVLYGRLDARNLYPW